MDITYTYGICVSIILLTDYYCNRLKYSCLLCLIHGKIIAHVDPVKVRIDRVISTLQEVLADREYVEDLYVEIEVVYTEESQGGIEVLRFDTTGVYGE